jgi:hypothetical protein
LPRLHLSSYRLVDIKPDPSTITHVQFAFAHFVDPPVSLGSSRDQLAEQRVLKSRAGGMVGNIQRKVIDLCLDVATFPFSMHPAL